jgi:hypothetical protein
MINTKGLFKRTMLGFMLTSLSLLGGCGYHTATWQEEVKLLDGRVITITQKRLYDANLPREFWLSFKLSEFGNQEITWHENLPAQVLNVYQGKLYVVGTADTEQSIRQYGTLYVGYRYEAGTWKHIQFSEIPVAIYDSNLLIANEPPNGVKFVSFSIKAEEMKDDTLGVHYKKIDPKLESPNS